jgi:hypothetical protein
MPASLHSAPTTVTKGKRSLAFNVIFSVAWCLYVIAVIFSNDTLYELIYEYFHGWLNLGCKNHFVGGSKCNNVDL